MAGPASEGVGGVSGWLRFCLEVLTLSTDVAHSGPNNQEFLSFLPFADGPESGGGACIVCCS